MKITKQILKDLIMEELQEVEQPPTDANAEETEEPAMASKAAFAKKLRELSVQVPKMKLDSAEVELINSVLAELLNFANNTSGKQRLTVLKKKLSMILGIE